MGLDITTTDDLFDRVREAAEQARAAESEIVILSTVDVESLLDLAEMNEGE